jgi:protein-tyrosine phosphatase
MTAISASFSQQQLRRLSKFSVDVSVDIHCHCLPGVDDGPSSMHQAIGLCRKLANDGTTTVIATPHQLGGYEGTNLGTDVLKRVGQLQDAVNAENIPLTIVAGADVRLDLRLMDLLAAGDVLTLAAGPYLLLELPHETLIDLRRPVALLAQRNIRTILSHPERHHKLAGKPDLLLPWLQAGAILQVTAGSLLGQFGPQAEKTGWQLLEAGLVSIIASDAHNTEDRPPSMTGAIAAISSRLGHAAARRVCIENPLRVLRGMDVDSPDTFRGLQRTSATVLRAPSSPRWRWGF